MDKGLIQTRNNEIECQSLRSATLSQGSKLKADRGGLFTTSLMIRQLETHVHSRGCLKPVSCPRTLPLLSYISTGPGVEINHRLRALALISTECGAVQACHINDAPGEGVGS